MLAIALTLAAVVSQATGYAWGATNSSTLATTLPNGRTVYIGLYGHTTAADATRKADWLIRTYAN